MAVRGNALFSLLLSRQQIPCHYIRGRSEHTETYSAQVHCLESSGRPQYRDVLVWVYQVCGSNGCRQSLAYLCAVTRLALTLDFQMMGSLDGLSAILGCPLHMPRLEKLQRPALLVASPHQQWVLCSSLLLAINWIRELLNAWAHHVQPHQ